MEKKTQLKTLDQKIKDLQDRKKLLEQKQLLEVSKIIKKTHAEDLPPEMLTGVLLEAVEAFHQKKDSTKRWEEKGKAFLKSPSKKGDKKESDSFRVSEKS